MNVNKVASLLREEVEKKNVDAQTSMNLLGDEDIHGEEISTPQSDLDLPATPKNRKNVIDTFETFDLEKDNPYTI